MEGNERIGVPGNPGGVVAKAALQGVVSEGKDGVEEVWGMAGGPELMASGPECVLLTGVEAWCGGFEAREAKDSSMSFTNFVWRQYKGSP